MILRWRQGLRRGTAGSWPPGLKAFRLPPILPNGACKPGTRCGEIQRPWMPLRNSGSPRKPVAILPAHGACSAMRSGSRRNLQTQLWAIEDAVGREDIAGALRHYDVALRTKAQSRAILYPVLASAIRDAQVRAELVRTLVSRPLWADDFLGYAAKNGENAQATAALLTALHQRNVPIPEPVNAALIGSMVARGQGGLPGASMRRCGAMQTAGARGIRGSRPC